MILLAAHSIIRLHPSTGHKKVIQNSYILDVCCSFYRIRFTWSTEGQCGNMKWENKKLPTIECSHFTRFLLILSYVSLGQRRGNVAIWNEEIKNYLQLNAHVSDVCCSFYHTFHLVNEGQCGKKKKNFIYFYSSNCPFKLPPQIAPSHCPLSLKNFITKWKHNGRLEGAMWRGNLKGQFEE